MIDEIKLEEEKIKENLQKQKEKIQSKIVIEDPVVKITFKRILAYFIIITVLFQTMQTKKQYQMMRYIYYQKITVEQ